MKKILGSIAISLVLAGCATNEPTAGYVYKPAELSNATKKVLQNIEKNDNMIEFINEESLVVISSKAGHNRIFRRGGRIRELILNDLCESDMEFFKFIRESGAGIKYRLADRRGKKTIGPWNKDVCTKKISN